ncbi:hypothetical protein [Pseudomonas sp. NPDC089569]|uniref:hypothetical protein n=1 Tax=Pseudomonas sp. NPDC089569 TaxID=3390722 RepID=UPI003D02BC8E
MFITTSLVENNAAIAAATARLSRLMPWITGKFDAPAKMAAGRSRPSFSDCAGQGVAGICTHNQYSLAMANFQ